VCARVRPFRRSRFIQNVVCAFVCCKLEIVPMSMCRAAAEAAEAELMQVNNQLAALQVTEADIDSLEHRYWCVQTHMVQQHTLGIRLQQGLSYRSFWSICLQQFLLNYFACCTITKCVACYC